MQYQLIATTGSGFESLVGNELRHLGYEVEVQNYRVLFSGNFDDIIKTNIWLRTADRVKILIGKFKAQTFEELFDKTFDLDWDEFLPLDANFPVSGKSQKSKLHHVPSIQAIVKKAIVKKLSKIYHRNTFLLENGAKYPLEVSVVKDEVWLTLDTTGDSLFKRGYRRQKGIAPLKENFAASLVYLSHWYPEMPFFDPMCGSGTLPIEAAMIGKNIAPGLYRNFAFENWENFENDKVEIIRKNAREQIKNIKLEISGYDIDGKMIEIAKENAFSANVADTIKFKQLAVKDFKTDKTNGVIVVNPPYGERLSDKDNVHTLYKQMGEVFKPLESFSKYILTSDLNFEKYYGKKATKKRKLYNGFLRTDLFQYWGKKIR